MGSAEEGYCCEHGVADFESARLYTEGKEVAEVIVDWQVGSNNGREELFAKCIFDGFEEGPFVWDNLADVLPLCHEAANKPSICRVREACGAGGKLVNAIYTWVDHGM